ncbi:MAG TPA: hypothetical protein VGM30_17525 [Puia sp.]|jgi:hypothetical protein
MLALSYIYIAFILLAFLSSLVCWRSGMAVHLKVFSCLLGLTFVVEFFAVVAPGLHVRPRLYVYNVFFLLQFWTYGYYYYRLLRVRLLKRFILVYLAIFPLFWASTVFFLLGFNRLDSYLLIMGSFFSIVFSLLYYFQLITDQEVPPLRMLPEFWIATGMLLFYLGALPYFGTLNFLVHHILLAGTGGLVNAVRMLDILLYAAIGFGFACRALPLRTAAQPIETPVSDW